MDDSGALGFKVSMVWALGQGFGFLMAPAQPNVLLQRLIGLNCYKKIIYGYIRII